MFRILQLAALAAICLLIGDAPGSWGAGCAAGSQFTPVGVRVVKSSAKSKKTAAKGKATKGKATKGKGRQVCPDGCNCACNDEGVCKCFRDGHCDCKSCKCGLTDRQALAAVDDELREQAKVTQNFGVRLDKLHKSPRYRINGRPASRETVLAKLKEDGREAEAPLADDSSKLPITVIGAGREAVQKDLAEHPAFAAVRNDLLVQGYDAENWAVSRYGFKGDGKPSVYLQDRSGRVLLRRDDYAGGPELLAKQVADATALAKLRKRDPNYDPKRDPDGRKPLVPAVGGAVPLPVIVAGLAVLGLGAATYLRRKDGE